MTAAYEKEVKAYLLGQFLSELDVWAHYVIKAFEAKPEKKIAATSVNYTLILKKNLTPCIQDFDLIILDAFDALYKLAKKHKIDLDEIQLIPIHLWMDVEDDVEDKLTTLFSKIKVVLRKHTEVLKTAPDSVTKVVNDLKDILKTTPKDIYDILNTELKK